MSLYLARSTLGNQKLLRWNILEGIDGRIPPGVKPVAKFNLNTEKPTMSIHFKDVQIQSISRLFGRWCMAVLN